MNNLRLVAPVLGTRMSWTGRKGTVPPILSLSVFSTASREICLCAWRSALSIYCDPNNDENSLDIMDSVAFQFSFYVNDVTTFGEFCRALPLASVQRLFVFELFHRHVLVDLTRDIWEQCFGHLRHVKELSVYGSSGIHIPGILQPYSSTGPDGVNKHHHLFPSVETLKLQYHTMTDKAVQEWNTMFDDSAWIVKTLQNGRVHQHLEKCGLTMIIVRKANHLLPEHAALMWNAAGAFVDWDEIIHWGGIEADNQSQR